MKTIIICTVVLLLFIQQQYVVALNMDSLAFLFSTKSPPVTQISNEMTQQIADRGLDILNGLQSNQRDCFQNSTLTIKNGCQQLVSDENTQIKYALMLTLCELATAQISVPVECQLDHPSNHLPACIKKLATIPQTWTTYSGYYRDVITICFAIRYPLEKELLLQAQQNMTYYQSKNYDLLQQQQQDLYSWRQQEIRLLDIIRLQQNDLWDEFTSLQKTSTNELLELVTTIKQTKQMATDAYTTQQISMNASQQHLEETVRQWDMAFQFVDRGLDSIRENMNAISVWQNQTLTMCHHWQEWQNQATQQWQQSMHHAHQNLLQLINYTENHIQRLQDDILDIHTMVSTMTKPVRLLFDSILGMWTNGIHIGSRFVGWTGLLASYHLLPSSLWYTLGKLVVLVYYAQSTDHWAPITICLLLIAKLLGECQRKHYPFLFSLKTTSPPVLSKGGSFVKTNSSGTKPVVSEMNQSCSSSDRLELYYSLLMDE